MLANAAGQVFVGQRRDSAAPAWQMPQGGIDDGESPRAAALRELEEETGVPPALVEVLGETAEWHRYDLPADLVGRALGGRYRGQAQKWVLMRFLGRDADIDIATAHPEFSAWRWLAPEDLPALIVPFKRPIYEAVLAEFAPRLVPAG
jgi:putative (di)nucleoside polyphosphate hydrolase